MGCNDSALRPLLFTSSKSDRAFSSEVEVGRRNYSLPSSWIINGSRLSSRETAYGGFDDDDEEDEELYYRRNNSRRLLSKLKWFWTMVFTKVWLLVWKNLLLRKRHYVVTTFEILLPTFFAFLLAYARTQSSGQTFDFNANQTSVYPDVSEEDLKELLTYAVSCDSCSIAYCPKNENTDAVIEALKGKLPGTKIEWKGYQNEAEIEVRLASLTFNTTSNESLRGAIVFQDGLKDFSGTLRYKIRLVNHFDTQLIFPWFQLPGPNGENTKHYSETGFAGLQLLLDKVLVEKASSQSPSHHVSLQAFPYPPFVINVDFSMFYHILLPQFICLGFIFIVPSIIRCVVNERETGIKELMKMSGLPNWMHWVAWMINSLVVLIISISIIVFLFFYTFNVDTGPVIVYSDPSIWWLVLFLYVMSSTAFCFFISSFFQRPSLAITIGIVLWLVSYYAVVIPIEQKYQTLSMFHKLVSAVLPNVSIYMAVKVMSAFEGKAEGAHWSNLAEPISSVDPMSLGLVCLMFIFDTILYMSLTVYLESVLPSEYGVRKPWYYIFQPSSWRRAARPEKNGRIGSSNSAHFQQSDQNGFEHELNDLPVGIDILRLKKQYRKGKVAVDDISLKIYDGQITALLGHNGAGKTTTMSMLTGLFAPTNGTAVVNGFDINTQMNEVRKSLGLCPQHNMLFNKLTVMEHLVFFGRLKGLSHSNALQEAVTLLNKLQLSEKSNTLSMALSGGQKRKLSLGIALIGGSKVVILDEPTSGMDPEARRAIWDILLEMRGQRTILLTTHFMEEADVLGDRIAIMADGKIKCCGSSLFLKKFYGTGYTLSFSVAQDAEVDRIMQLVKNHVSRARIKTGQKRRHSEEVSIVLPTDTTDTAVFPAMFLDIADNKSSLGIDSIGLSLTTMDEVFVKVGELTSGNTEEDTIPEEGFGDVDNRNHNEVDGNGSSKEFINGAVHRPQRLHGIHLVWQQFCALLMKKYIYTLRKRKLMLSQLLIPVAILITAILVSNKSFDPPTSPPPLKMSLGSYKKPITLYTSTDEDIGNHFASVVGHSAKKADSPDIIGALADIGKNTLASYREQYIVAAAMNNSHIKAMFSSIPNHAAPLALNLAANTILSNLAPGTSTRIEVTNQPLQSDISTLLDAAQPNPVYSITVPILFAVFMPIGLALLAASYIVFPVEERLCQAKQLQMMTGVSPLVYWGSAFVWDFCVMFLLICVMITCFPIFQSYGVFTSYGGAGVAFLILFVYGLSAIPFSYLLSLVVQTVPGGFALVTIIHVLSGLILCMVVYMLELGSLEETASAVRHVGRFFPTFGASMSTMRFTEIATKNSRCNILSDSLKEIICNPKFTNIPATARQCCDSCDELLDTKCFEPIPFITWIYEKHSFTDSLQSVPGIGQELLYMSLLALAYLTLLIFLEYGIPQRILHLVFKAKSSLFRSNVDDSDVLKEAERVERLVQDGKVNEDAIVVENLCKSFGSFAAVSNLSFGVHHGECFGLLGVNGAGKTTAFRMLTGDEIRSNGNCYANMYNLETQRKQFLANIGYCPQFDGIVGVLSGREMLKLFCGLRGVPSDFANVEADKWLGRMGLTNSGNVQCQKYSGGMKRRLSAAMAMIGDPPVVLLDEPTSGVDPVARRQFWKVISSLKSSGQAVILTSHSMEECEALCSRLGIMVNGQLQCLGRVQQLKNKFAQGYSLCLKLKPNIPANFEPLNVLERDIENRFSPCVLKDRHQNVLHYQLLNTSASWDTIFKHMEELKSQYEIIEDYSVSETTLEEVFLSFARKQYPSRHADISLFKKLLTCHC